MQSHLSAVISTGEASDLVSVFQWISLKECRKIVVEAIKRFKNTTVKEKMKSSAH